MANPTYTIDTEELDEALKELEGALQTKAMIELGEDIQFDTEQDPITRIKAMSEFTAETI